MNSPVAQHQPLEKVTLEEGLTAWRCPESGGHYIKAEDYWKWQRQSGLDDEEPAALGEPTGNTESLAPPESEWDDQVKICPETGSLMSRYRVGHGLTFRVDRSITGGVWLDAGEWEALREGDLHHHLHRIFTAPWQRAIIRLEQTTKAEARLRERLGEELYQKVLNVRNAIAGHPARAEALAFLEGPLHHPRSS